MMSSQERVLLVISCLFFLSVFLLVGLFAQPMTDDFDVFLIFPRLGIWGATVDWYENWTGRYASSLLIGMWTSLDLVQGYWTTAFITIGSFLAGSYALARAVFPVEDRRDSLFWALLFCCVFLTGLKTTATGEALYWMTGGITYQVGNALALCCMAALIHLVSKPSPVTLLTASMLGFFTVGMSETHLVWMLFVLAVTPFLVYALGRRLPLHFYVMALVTVAGALIVLGAPGNAVRASLIAPPPHLKAVIGTIVASASQFLYLGSHVETWAVSFLFLPIASRIADILAPQVVPARRWLIAAAPLALLGSLLVLNFPAFWVMGTVGPPRAYSTYNTAFLVGWFFSIVLLLAAFRGWRPGIVLTQPRWITTVMVAALLFGLFGSETFRGVFMDVGRGYRFAQEYSIRYALLEEARAKGVSEITVPPIDSKPLILMNFDPPSQPEHYSFKSYAKYFGLESVSLAGAPPQ